MKFAKNSMMMKEMIGMKKLWKQHRTIQMKEMSSLMETLEIYASVLKSVRMDLSSARRKVMKIMRRKITMKK